MADQSQPALNIDGHFMNKTHAAWITYDIGSSAYVFLITAVAFPLYFKVYVTENAPWSDMVWGSILAASNILAGLLAPVLGAAADLNGKRLRYLAIATAVCCLATIGLSVPNSEVIFISAMFVISYVAYLLAAGLYDSLLKQIVARGTVGWLSGLGWGLGYIGGLVCYLLSTSLFGASDADSPATTFSLSFIVVGIFYSLVSGTALFCLRHLKQPAAVALTSDWKTPFIQVSHTIKEWSAMREVPRLIITTHVVTGAALSLGMFTPLILAGYFGLLIHQVAMLSAIFALVSIPATVVSGALTTRISPLRLIFWLMPLWLLLMLALIIGKGWYAGLLVAILLGVLLGPTNSIARTIAAGAIDETEASELFGMAALANRISAALGPLFFGVLSSASASRWLPVIVIGSLLTVALSLMPRHKNLRGSIEEFP